MTPNVQRLSGLLTALLGQAPTVPQLQAVAGAYVEDQTGLSNDDIAAASLTAIRQQIVRTVRDSGQRAARKAARASVQSAGDAAQSAAGV